MASIIAILLAALSVGPYCPACSGEAIRVRAPWLLSKLSRLERRWCLACGWDGLLRCGELAPMRRTAVDAEQPRAV